MPPATALHDLFVLRRCELKLTGGQHEGCEPGRTRVVLAPVVDPSPRSLAEHAPAPVLTPEVTLLSEVRDVRPFVKGYAPCFTSPLLGLLLCVG
jgi:hypothetical protein